MHAEEILNGVPLPECAGKVDRRSYLPKRATGHRVVHLGCVDEGLTGTRAATGSLLHEELARVTKDLVGVDLSEDGLAAMKRAVPGRYLQGDVEKLGDLELPEVCDLVIAGEIIEHLPSPGRFLSGLRDYLDKTGATALLTTPNSYSWQGYLRFALGRREPTHPDHLIYYSPATIVRTMEAAGLEVVALRAHWWARPSSGSQRVRALLDRAISAWNPWLSVGLVVEVAPDRVTRASS